MRGGPGGLRFAVLAGRDCGLRDGLCVRLRLLLFLPVSVRLVSERKTVIEVGGGSGEKGRE